MANRRVAIYQSAKVKRVWSYYRPVTGRNNKVKPDWCHVNGHTEHHPGSDYIIKWCEGKTQRTRKCKNALHNELFDPQRVRLRLFSRIRLQEP